MTEELSVLISELSSPVASSRSGAAEALMRLGDGARGAAVLLARCAGDDNEETREFAVAALEELGVPSVTDVAAFVELLRQDNADVAYWAATLLGRLGEQAVTAVPALCTALHEIRPLIVRERAAWALGRIGRIGGESAIAALRKAANHPQPRFSRLAQHALDRVSR